jgi:signal transduction histidine kinase
MARLVQDLVQGPQSPPNGFSIAYGSIDMVALARDQIELAAARSNHHSIVLEAPQRLEIQCDGERVAQVLANLLGNAIAHTAAGEIRVSVAREGENVHLSVQDRGPGIPVDRLEEIFEPRVRLARRRTGRQANGAGLGLSIARQIAEAHGGRVWAENCADEGAAFHVVLPIVPPRAARAGAHEMAQQLRRRRRGAK